MVAVFFVFYLLNKLIVNLQGVKLSLMSLSLEAVKMLENMNVDAEKEK